MANTFLNENSTASVLPLKIQEYLWQHVGPLLKIKLTPGSFESSCVALERCIVGNKTKELKELRRDMYQEFKDVPRWTFVKGALPYVIHGCAAILEQRRQLGLTDKFTVPVTKLFSTLHWILIESCQECCHDNTSLDLKAVELFVQNIIPYMQHLHDSDLKFSLEMGVYLWQPLWNHFPPLSTLLALPVVKTKKRNTRNTLLPKIFDEEDRPLEATYFDVALVKTMFLVSWNFTGYKWGIIYLEKMLMSLIHNKYTDLETCHCILTMKRHSPTKNSYLMEGDTRSSPKNFKMKFPLQERPSQKVDLISEEVPDELAHLVTKDGSLRLSNVAKLMSKLSKNETLRSLTGNILVLISLLTEIAFHETYTSDLSKHYHEVLLSSFVSAMKLLGCDYNCTVKNLGGVKGDHFRLIMHEYLKRIVHHNLEKSETWFRKFIKNETPFEAIRFLHSLTTFCRQFTKYKKDFIFYSPSDGGDHDLLNGKAFLKLKKENEELLLKWLVPSLYEKLTDEWNTATIPTDLEYLTLAVQLTKYLHDNHRKIHQKIVMCGILNSFDKSRRFSGDANDEKDDSYNDFDKYDRGSTSSTLPRSNPYATGNFEFTFKTPKTGKHAKKEKKQLVKTPRTEIDDDAFDPRYSSFPDSSSVFDEYIKMESLSGYSASTLPKSFLSKTKKVFMSKQPTASVSTGVLGSISEDKPTETTKPSHQHKRGRKINLHGLYDGVKQLRYLLDIGDLGVTPDETVVAAMLDLEAPVLARTTYLIELAHFVHKCNKHDWPSLIKLSERGFHRKGLPPASELDHLKDRAGLLFHKWGVAISKKLEDILIQEKNKSGKASRHEKVDFMYEGDLSVITSSCPYALRYAACQLLLEITAYLRETFLNLVLRQMRSDEQGVLPRPRCNTDSQENAPCARKPKQSIATGIAKKISAVRRKKSSLGILLPGKEDSFEESPKGSPNTNRLQTAPSFATGKRSPKILRKVSHLFAKPTLRHSLSLNVAVSSEEHEALPDETLDFPWLKVINKLNKATNFLCYHGGENCADNCPLEQAKSCQAMITCLMSLYKTTAEEKLGHDNGHGGWEIKRKHDPTLKYLESNVLSLMQAPYAALCKGAFVMDNFELIDTMAVSWEVLLYPDQPLKAAAASLFLVAACRIEQPVAAFLTKQMISSDVNDRARALQRFCTLWDNQHQVYDHLEETAKLNFRPTLLKLEYALPSKPIGKETAMTPHAPWDPETPNLWELDLSGDEEETYYLVDSDEQKKKKAESQKKKLREMREKFMISAVPFTLEAAVKYIVQEEEEAVTVQPVRQPFFPQSMGHGILHLIRLLDDTALTSINNQSVNGIAYQMIWRFLVAYPETFFQIFFEKITKIRFQEELIRLLRKLLIHFPYLPSHAAQLLLNHLVGVISFYERSNKVGSHEKIAAVMPLLWQITCSIPKLYFSEMQQSLRREHIDHTIMVTANVSSVKEINVVYMKGNTKDNKERLSGVPDEATFGDLLRQSKEAFQVEGDDSLILVDRHTNLILHTNAKVRDVYVYKRGFPCPTMKLEQLKPDSIYQKQQQELTNKLIHINQLMLTSSIFQALPNKKHLMFLYYELYQQFPNFPRKAIDLDLDLCAGIELGKEISSMDVILKDNWVKFMNRLLVMMSDGCNYNEETIAFFLDPINAALLWHCEDALILRSCLAALINIAKHYGRLFAQNGSLFPLGSESQANLGNLCSLFCIYGANSIIVTDLHTLFPDMIKKHWALVDLSYLKGKKVS